MTTIVIADDHPIVRQGLRTLLESEQDYAVVGEAADGFEVLTLVEQLKPDVLIVDLMMPGLNGLEVTRRVRQRFPHSRIVILSMYTHEPYVVEALRNGAMGYVLKAMSTSTLVHALQQVLAGQRYLSPPLTERAIEVYIQRTNNTNYEIDRYEMLTSREREVLHLAAHSYTNAEIAARLSISPRTVETHRTNLMRKLSLSSQTELLRYALQRGILSGEV